MKLGKMYLLILVITTLFCIALYSTYAMFTASVNAGEIVNLTASSLPTGSSIQEYERLTISSGTSMKINLNINNTTSDTLYYGAWYEMIMPSTKNEDIVIARYDETATEAFGNINANSNTTVTLLLGNDTNEDVIINVGVGYSTTNDLGLPGNRFLITDVEGEYVDTSGYVPVLQNFNYTGNQQQFTVTKAGQYRLEVWGAEGGAGRTFTTGGGKGGYSAGTVNLNAGDILYIYTGGKGSASSNSSSRSGAGFNANAGNVTNGATASYYGGGGGGASDIRINNTSIYARVIVAGGGGGKCGYNNQNYCNGGAAGGTTGSRGIYQASTTNNTQYSGQGATLTAGGATGTYYSYKGSAGSFGSGGYGGTRNSTSYPGAGAGGGGWYGGGGGTYQNAGGGGGSGYVYSSQYASNYPSGRLIDTNYYLTDTVLKGGTEVFDKPDGTDETGHSGNGHVRISSISPYPSLDGLTDLSITLGTNYNLSSGVTCNSAGDGCTIYKISVTDTSTLAEGSYVVKYIVKDNSNNKYKFTRNLTIQ